MALTAPRLLDTLPLLADEGGIHTLPLAVQYQPLRLAVDVWDSYEADYLEMLDGGSTNLRVVLQAFRDGQSIGEPVEREMQPNPSALFPIEWQIEAPTPLRDREYVIQYQYWYADVFNESTSFPSDVYYDRTSPNSGESFDVSGPDLIDRAHLDANGGFARFELPRWLDIRLEDRVSVFFQLVGGSQPGTPLKDIEIVAGNIDQDPVELLIDEALLRGGDFDVTFQLQDRAGNVNRGSSVLRVKVDLSVVSPVLLLKPKRLERTFVNLSGWINCAALDYATREPWLEPLPKGVRFQVPLPQDGVAVGDWVQMGWHMCRDQLGMLPIEKQPVWLDEVPLRADGFLVMDRLNELIVEAFARDTDPGRTPFEGSVRVSYKIRDSAGGTRTSEDEVVRVSLRGSSVDGLCTGPWMSKQVPVQQDRRLLMSVEEKIVREPIRSSQALEAYRATPKSTGPMGINSSAKPLAQPFTFVNALDNGPNVRPREVPRRATYKVPPPDDPNEDQLQDNDNDFLAMEIATPWADTGGSDYDGSFDLVVPEVDGVLMPFTQEDIDDGRVIALPYPVNPSLFPLTVHLPPSFLITLGEGAHSLRYVVFNDQAVNPDESPAQDFTLDWTPPSNTRIPLALQLPAVSPPIEDGVPVFTQQYLDDHDPVIFRVAGYTSPRAGDQVRLLNGASGNELVTWTDLWPESEATAPARELRVPAAVLRSMVGDGQQLRYQLRDRPENDSGLSAQLNITVRLQADPTNLEAPVIESPINRGTLFPVTNRVTVTLVDNASLLDDDEIVVSWVDGTDLARELPPFRYADRQTSVDWAFLSSPNSRARYTASVTYTVRRAGRPDPFGPSPAATPEVDLSIVGPVNPDEPNPVNPTLSLLTVQGGSGRSPDDAITPLDATAAVRDRAKIVFPMPTGLVSGNHVTLVYGTEQVTALVLDDDDLAEPTLEFNLPWATIEAQGNGVILAYYELREAAGAANYQRSRNTEVTVSAIVVTMKNFVWFDSSRSALSIPNGRQNQRPGTATGRTGVINCSIQPWNGITLILRDERAGDPVSSWTRVTVNDSISAAVTAADEAVVQGNGTPAQTALEASATAIRAAQAAADTEPEQALIATAQTAAVEAAAQAAGTPAQDRAIAAVTSLDLAASALAEIGSSSQVIEVGDLLTVYWTYHTGNSLGQTTPTPVEHVLHSVTVPANYNPANGVNYQISYTDELFGQTVNPPPATGAASIVCRFSLRRGADVWISSPCLVKYNTTQNGLICRDWSSSPARR